MDINQIADDAKSLSRRLLNAVKGASPGMIATSVGLIQALIGIGFIMYFCIVGYPDQDELDDLKYLPAILQFIATSPVYVGMFFILLGSVVMIGGLILSAVDRAQRLASQQLSDLHDQIQLVKATMATPSNRADDLATGRSLVVHGQPGLDEKNTIVSGAKSRHIRFWPFGS